jgi:hypothetical protein
LRELVPSAAIANDPIDVSEGPIDRVEIDFAWLLGAHGLADSESRPGTLRCRTSNGAGARGGALGN